MSSSLCKTCHRAGTVHQCQSGQNQGKYFVICDNGCKNPKDSSKNLWSHWYTGPIPPPSLQPVQALPDSTLPHPRTGVPQKLQIDQEYRNEQMHHELLSENQQLRDELNQQSIRLGQMQDEVKRVSTLLQMIYKKLMEQKPEPIPLSFGNGNNTPQFQILKKNQQDYFNNAPSTPQQFHSHAPQFDIHEKDEMNDTNKN